MNEFKEKIYELIIDSENQEINFENLTTIYNWPDITFYDEDADSSTSEGLDTENSSITDITDDYIEVTCGGDWQDCHLVRIELLDGELSVTSCEAHEFLTGLDYEELIEELNS